MKRIKLLPIDILTIVYCLWVIIIVSLNFSEVRGGWLYLVLYPLYIVFAFLIAFLDHKYQGRLLHFIHTFYPLLFLTLVYKSLENFIPVIWNGYLDKVVLAMEKSIFGCHPTLVIDKYVNKTLNEIMKFLYFTYYFYMSIPPLILYLQKRFKEARRFIFILIFTYYACYVCFVLFPVEGPGLALSGLYKHRAHVGYFFAPLQNKIMKNFAAKGACIPSSHVAVAFVSLWLMRKFFGKRIFYIILPFTIGLALSTVYNRYHYVTDMVTGVLAAIIFYNIGKILYRKLSYLDPGSSG